MAVGFAAAVAAIMRDATGLVPLDLATAVLAGGASIVCVFPGFCRSLGRSLVIVDLFLLDLFELGLLQSYLPGLRLFHAGELRKTSAGQTANEGEGFVVHRHFAPIVDRKPG
ncbi:MAG: hypothetical protein WAM75_19895, partial [Xanthobacteraceae bacterium]